jgi:septal ring factor EnvC (AmiA/AmiB activator)
MILRVLTIAVLLSAIGINSAAADALDQSRQIINQTNQELQATQKAIDKTDETIAQMLSEYKSVNKEIDNYRIYNGQLKEIVDSQMGEMQVLANDIDKIEATGLKIMPFMQKMIDGLDRFIASDFPFLPEERQKRLARLNANMKRADLSIAAKFRQILEAYQIEIDYGNTLEVYEENLKDKKVVFLKIGRIGLYYLSLDKEHCGAWEPIQHQWQPLEDMDYKLSIAKAIKIAKKQRAPDLFFAAVPPARRRP